MGIAAKKIRKTRSDKIEERVEKEREMFQSRLLDKIAEHPLVTEHRMRSTKTVEGCQLEIDEERGVIYVHSPEGMTLVRVCKIPTILLRMERSHGSWIDITFDRELAKGFNR